MGGLRRRWKPCRPRLTRLGVGESPCRPATHSWLWTLWAHWASSGLACLGKVTRTEGHTGQVGLGARVGSRPGHPGRLLGQGDQPLPGLVVGGLGRVLWVGRREWRQSRGLVQGSGGGPLRKDLEGQGSQKPLPAEAPFPLPAPTLRSPAGCLCPLPASFCCVGGHPVSHSPWSVNQPIESQGLTVCSLIIAPAPRAGRSVMTWCRPWLAGWAVVSAHPLCSCP